MMRFTKKELEIPTENLELILPLVMLTTAEHSLCDFYKDYTCSIEYLWHLITFGKNPLPKKKQEILVSYFQDFLEDYDLTWNDDIQLECAEQTGNYVVLDLKDVFKVFGTEKRFDKMSRKIMIVLRIHSHLNGAYIYLSKEELLEELVGKYENEDGFNINDSSTWFKGFKYDDLKEMAQKFVAYPDVDLLLNEYHNEDSGIHEPIMSERSLDRYLEELEELGIICKVRTNYGKFKNKAVYCRVEHREVCIALYERMEMLQNMAQTYDKEPESLEEIRGLYSSRKRSREDRRRRVFD